MVKSGRYKGQSKTEFNKNYTRISDIISKSDGDDEKASKLALTQAKLITNEIKALNRAMAAKEMGYVFIHDIFFHRAYELGSVSKQNYRDYKLEILGI